MSPAHLHIVLAHAPAVGIVFGLIVLGFGLFRSNEEVFRAALVIFTLSGLVAIAVYLLGDSAEEIVEDMAGISHDLIHEHEEVALWAMLSGALLGLISLAGLWLSRRSRPKGLTLAVVVVSLFTLGIMAVTANRGGQINHPEIRSATTAPSPTRHDDDD